LGDSQHTLGGPAQPVQRGNHQRVTGLYCCESLIEAWTGGSSPRDAMIDIQVIAPNTSGHQVLDLPIALLATSRRPCIPNKFIHATSHCLTTHVVDTILDFRCKTELQDTQMLEFV